MGRCCWEEDCTPSWHARFLNLPWVWWCRVAYTYHRTPLDGQGLLTYKTFSAMVAIYSSCRQELYSLVSLGGFCEQPCTAELSIHSAKFKERKSTVTLPFISRKLSKNRGQEECCCRLMQGVIVTRLSCCCRAIKQQKIRLQSGFGGFSCCLFLKFSNLPFRRKVIMQSLTYELQMVWNTFQLGWCFCQILRQFADGLKPCYLVHKLMIY